MFSLGLVIWFYVSGDDGTGHGDGDGERERERAGFTIGSYVIYETMSRSGTKMDKYQLVQDEAFTNELLADLLQQGLLLLESIDCHLL